MLKGYGDKIKKFRLLKKMTQDDLGERLGGITKSYISKVENEKTLPSLETFVAIAQILEVDIGDLLGEQKTPPGELKAAGVEWMILGEELEKEGITKEQVKLWAEIVKKSTNKTQ